MLCISLSISHMCYITYPGRAAAESSLKTDGGDNHTYLVIYYKKPCYNTIYYNTTYYVIIYYDKL